MIPPPLLLLGRRRHTDVTYDDYHYHYHYHDYDDDDITTNNDHYHTADDC